MTESNHAIEYLFEGFRLNVQDKSLTDPEGEPVQISHRALDTLAVLVRNRGKTLSKATLIDTVWPDVYVEENNLNQAITGIRKALGDNKQASRFIKTFKGKGYCFIAEVKQVSRDDEPPVDTPSVDNDRAAVPALLDWLKTPAYGLLAIAALVLAAVVWQLQPSLFATTGSNMPLAGNMPAEEPVIPGSIAVLPLTTLNPDDENRVLAMGMHLELIDRLSRVNSLKLISHNGVPASSIQEQPLTDLGRMLNVENLVTGSILLLEDNARINLYLIDAGTGVILWTDNYDVDTDNMTGSVPSRIALDIAAAMDVRVSANNRIAVQETATESFEAYRYQLAAVSAFTSMDFAKAFTLSKQALELDPQYIDALQMFSRINSVLTSTPLPGMTANDHILLGLEAAEQSIAQAPDNHRGYILKAVALGSASQWEAAMTELDKLQAMGAPPASLQFLVPILMSLGYFEDAVTILEANLQQEPINLYARGFLLSALEMSGDRLASRMEYELGEELNPEWWGDTVNIFLAMGRQESLGDIDSLNDISEDTRQVLHDLEAGDMDAVKQGLASWLPHRAVNTVELIYYSAIAAYSGDPEYAIALMEQAVDEVGINIHWVWLPVFDEARKHDSFKRLLEKNGMVDYWRSHGWPPYCRPVETTFACDTGAYDLISMQ